MAKKKLSFTNFIYGLLIGILFGIVGWLIIRAYFPEFYPLYSGIAIGFIFALIGGRYHKLSKALFKGLWFILKAFGIGIKYLFSLFKKKRIEVQERKKEEARPKINAQYEKLDIVKHLDGDYNKFENKLLGSSSIIGIILG